jgi:hypothetical protein
MSAMERTRASAGCPSEEELVEYFRLRLPEPRMLAIEEHFAGCELCVEQSRAVFEVLVELDSWTPESHGEAVRREALVMGLAQAEAMEQEGSEWRNRLSLWRKRVARTADGAIELIVSASGARIVAKTLREFVAEGGFQFEPLTAARGAEEERGMAGPTAVLSAERPDVRVIVHDGNRVVVTIGNWPTERQDPGIVVIDSGGEQSPLRLELTRRADGVWATEFTREPGTFMVLFAPTERKF